jgi:hypothetical protein
MVLVDRIGTCCGATCFEPVRALSRGTETPMVKKYCVCVSARRGYATYLFLCVCVCVCVCVCSCVCIWFDSSCIPKPVLGLAKGGYGGYYNQFQLNVSV